MGQLGEYYSAISLRRCHPSSNLPTRVKFSRLDENMVAQFRRCLRANHGHEQHGFSTNSGVWTCGNFRPTRLIDGLLVPRKRAHLSNLVDSLESAEYINSHMWVPVHIEFHLVASLLRSKPYKALTLPIEHRSTCSTSCGRIGIEFHSPLCPGSLQNVRKAETALTGPQDKPHPFLPPQTDLHRQRHPKRSIGEDIPYHRR